MWREIKTKNVILQQTKSWYGKELPSQRDDSFTCAYLIIIIENYTYTIIESYVNALIKTE